jgi:hypothetical protein
LFIDEGDEREMYYSNVGYLSCEWKLYEGFEGFDVLILLHRLKGPMRSRSSIYTSVPPYSLSIPNGSAKWIFR